MTNEAAKEKTNKNNIRYHWIFYFFIIIFVDVAFWYCGVIESIFKLLRSCKEFQLDERGIILAAISTFVAILIPLHYSLVLDVISKIKDNGKITNDNKKCLKLYVASSDIVVYITALFGVSVLLEGAVAIGAYFQIIGKPKSCTNGIAIGLIITIILAMWRSLSFVTKKVELVDNKFFWWYLLSILLSTFIAIIWLKGLIKDNVAHHIEFRGIVTLAFFYFQWIFLKIPFMPISRLAL